MKKLRLYSINNWIVILFSLIVCLMLIFSIAGAGVAGHALADEGDDYNYLGEYPAMYPDEVSHYEIESSCGDLVTNYSTDGPVLTYTLNILGSCDLKVRIVDIDGIRSDYVTAINVNVKARPLPPLNFGVSS